jgi:hypothetical protein
MIVKPYEYIVGRLKGEFSPSDPGIYRSTRRNQTNSLAYNHPFQAKANGRTNFRIQADGRVRESHPPNSIYPVASQGRVPYRGLGISQWPVNEQTPHASNWFTERDLKIQELRELLYKNCPQQFAA